MENLQSAEKAYKELADLRANFNSLMKQNEDLTKRQAELESGSELARVKAENAEIRKMYEELSAAFTKQSKNLNDIITSYGVQVDEKPGKSQEEVEQDVEVNRIMDKIKAQNEVQDGNK